MNKDSNYTEPEVIILSNQEEIDAEEYLKDDDQVYRKKGEKAMPFKTSSLFWMRLGCFVGLIILCFVLFFKFIVLSINCIHTIINRFNNPQINQLFLKNVADYLNLSKVFLALCVGIINPFWGKKVMKFFFSMNNHSEKYSNWQRTFNFSI